MSVFKGHTPIRFERRASTYRPKQKSRAMAAAALDRNEHMRGWVAYRHGEASNANPHDSDSHRILYVSWRNGWLEAKAQAGG